MTISTPTVQPAPTMKWQTGPQTVPFEAGKRATWFNFAKEDSRSPKHVQFVAVNGGSVSARLQPLDKAIDEASRLSVGADRPAMAVLQASEGKFGVYNMFEQHYSTTDPKATTVPAPIFFEGKQLPHQNRVGFAPLVGAIVDGKSVWKPNFRS